MKLRQFLLLFLFFIATLLISIFVYDLLTNLDPENLATITTQNTNVVINNQINVRGLTNVTDAITSDNSNNVDNNTNSTLTPNNIVGVSPAVLITVGVLATLVVVGGGYGLIYYCLMGKSPTPNQGIELEYL